jgi:hypothetical protein
VSSACVCERSGRSATSVGPLSTCWAAVAGVRSCRREQVSARRAAAGASCCCSYFSTTRVQLLSISLREHRDALLAAWVQSPVSAVAADDGAPARFALVCAAVVLQRDVVADRTVGLWEEPVLGRDDRSDEERVHDDVADRLAALRAAHRGICVTTVGCHSRVITAIRHVTGVGCCSRVITATRNVTGVGRVTSSWVRTHGVRVS